MLCEQVVWNPQTECLVYSSYHCVTTAATLPHLYVFLAYPGTGSIIHQCNWWMMLLQFWASSLLLMTCNSTSIHWHSHVRQNIVCIYQYQEMRPCVFSVLPMQVHVISVIQRCHIPCHLWWRMAIIEFWVHSQGAVGIVTHRPNIIVTCGMVDNTVMKWWHPSHPIIIRCAHFLILHVTHICYRQVIVSTHILPAYNCSVF